MSQGQEHDRRHLCQGQNKRFQVKGMSKHKIKNNSPFKYFNVNYLIQIIFILKHSCILKYQYKLLTF